MNYSKVNWSYKQLFNYIIDELNVKPFATDKLSNGDSDSSFEDLVDTVQYNLNHGVELTPKLKEAGFPVI